MSIKLIIILLIFSLIRSKSKAVIFENSFPSDGILEMITFSSNEKIFKMSESFEKPITKSFNVTLSLMTKSGLHNESIVLPMHNDAVDSLKQVNFTKGAVFIIHGYLTNGEVPWIADLAKSYIEQKDINIFLVDWGRGASTLNYVSAAQNTRKVADMMTKFIMYLINFKTLNASCIHIIGHSLGAHIGGFIGKAIPNLYRITALDPARPLFSNSKRAKKTRLHKDDAKFVDVIHTDDFFLGCGLPEQIGDVDFYVNGGEKQPGCPTHMKSSNYFMKPIFLGKLRIDELLVKFGCSHLRSIEYFVESIKNTSCIFIGHKNITNFKYNDKVENEDTIMGLSTFDYPARGTFQIKTNSEFPYCQGNNKLEKVVAN